MMVGFIQPTSGHVYLNDEDVTHDAMYRRAQKGVGYLPQEPSVFRKLSVEDNIKAVLEMTDLSKAEQKDKLESLISEFRLDKVRKNSGDSLSGGERRRTEIARSFASSPKFILLDEPIAGIDPIAVEDIQYIVAKVKTKNNLFDENTLRQKVEGALHQKNHLLVKIYNRRAISVDEIVDDLPSYADRLRPMVPDTGLLLNQALDAGKTVVFEGGQATMLDVDHGTYPFVTSWNSTSGGAATGSGLGPNRLDRVIGIVKAYTTRVGAGPFPTELHDESGEWLRSKGFEFGTNTGRPRRTGWYDAPIARYSARINGVTDFVMTKLDVRTGLKAIPVCVAYDIDGVRVEDVRLSQSDCHHAAKP